MVNAAGIGIIKPLEQLTNEDFDISIDVNLKGTFYLLKAFLPAMKKIKEGLIINMPGVLGKTPMHGAGAYSASKYGINAFAAPVPKPCRWWLLCITEAFSRVRGSGRGL